MRKAAAAVDEANGGILVVALWFLLDVLVVRDMEAGALSELLCIVAVAAVLSGGVSATVLENDLDPRSPEGGATSRRPAF